MQPMHASRYIYSTHRSRDAAAAALEDYFATGEVSEGERPDIEHHHSRWCVTLEHPTIPTPDFEYVSAETAYGVTTGYPFSIRCF